MSDLGLRIAIPLATGLLFLFIGLSSRKPKLIGCGSGSGSSPPTGIAYSHLAFMNKRTVFGMRIVREPALEVWAQLFDPKSGQPMGPRLLWQGPDGSLSESTSINAGDQRPLMVLVGRQGDERAYVYTRECLNAAQLPTGLTALPLGARDLEIRLTDKIERSHRIRILRNQAGPTQLAFRWTCADRRGIITRGFGMIVSAFSRNR